MTRDEAITLIKQRLQRENDTAITARIQSEIILAQEMRLEGNAWLPWFLLSENLTANTTASEERLPVPNNFLREAEEGALWRYDPDSSEIPWVELTKDDYDFLLNKYPNEDAPVAYALSNEYFRLKPTPDAVYTMRMKCYLRDDPLTSDIENKWLANAADWLIAEVSEKIARQHLRNIKLADSIKGEIIEAKNRVYVVHEARMHANRKYSMGGVDG